MPTSRRRALSRSNQLRDDVHLLGTLVGEVLREQGGSELFDSVERIRRGAIWPAPWSPLIRTSSLRKRFVAQQRLADALARRGIRLTKGYTPGRNASMDHRHRGGCPKRQMILPGE